MKQLIIFASLLLFSGLFFSSCYKDVISPEIEYAPQAVSFSKDLQPIFTAKCTNVGCHVPGSKNPNLNDAATSYNNILKGNYINVLFPKQSPFYQNVYGSMAEFTTKDERQKIYDWIRNGARNN